MTLTCGISWQTCRFCVLSQRRRVHLNIGDRVLLVADLPTGRLAVHPPSSVGSYLSATTQLLAAEQ